MSYCPFGIFKSFIQPQPERDEEGPEESRRRGERNRGRKKREEK